MTWRYSGQHVFATAEASGVSGEWVVPDEVLTDWTLDPDEYFGVGRAVRVDAEGREWVLVDVDVDAVQARVDAYETDVADRFGPEPGEPDVGGWEVPENAGEVEWLDPLLGWYKYNCTVGSTTGWYVFDYVSDDIDPVAAPMDAWQRKLMFLGDDEYCSGVMVDADTILTAAHCTESDAGGQTWCSMENLDENSSGGTTASCHGVDPVLGFTQAPGWSGPPDAANDYALVHLDSSPGNGWMPLTIAGYDITLFQDHVQGFPRRDQACTGNNITDPALTTDDAHSGRQLFGADGQVQTIFPDYVRWNTSGARGMSGSPHFICPTGDCADLQWVTGVMAYANMAACPGTGNPEYCPTGATSGPRAAAIRAWVIANM